MPPVLDPQNSKVDGLAFLGLSLARKSKLGHPDSVTHQTAFDLNDVLDRDYEFLFSTNDDGWLVGGGEPGPPKTYKLAAKDSAHVEIMRIGTYRKEWGGVPQEEIIEVLQLAGIMIPQIEVLPTAVVANPDNPPELEIRFDMEPQIPDFDNPQAPLPVNWQLRFIHNQLFKRFIFPSRFCPGPFHSTILRKAEFRSEEHRKGYFDKCEEAIQRWRRLGSQPLNTERNGPDGTPLDLAKKEALSSQTKPAEHNTPDPETSPEEEMEVNESSDSISYIAPTDGGSPATQFVPSTQDATAEEEGMKSSLFDLHSLNECSSGLWLFTDRENITHFFEPNFLPPYNTPMKRKIIMEVLRDEWDEKTLSWKPCGQGSMTKAMDLNFEQPSSLTQTMKSALSPPPESAPTKNASSSLGTPKSAIDEFVDDMYAQLKNCCNP